MKHQIFSRWDSSRVVYECDLPDDTPSGMVVRLALEKATAARDNLRGSNLRGCDLSGCDLRDSNMSDCDLSGSNLSDSNMSDCDLSGSNLSGSNLRGCDLSGCDLSGCDLSGCDLSGCDLSDVKNDFWEILLRAPCEIDGLRAALVAGKVNGSTYEGVCACLVGTIANVRGVGVDYRDLGNGIKPNSSRPAERWFLGISTGDKPETNEVSRITVEWLDEFVALLNAALVQP